MGLVLHIPIYTITNKNLFFIFIRLFRPPLFHRLEANPSVKKENKERKYFDRGAFLLISENKNNINKRPPVSALASGECENKEIRFPFLCNLGLGGSPTICREYSACLLRCPCVDSASRSPPETTLDGVARVYL